MSLRHLAFLGIAAALAFSAVRVMATTVVAPEFPALVDQADYIVRAVVKSAVPEWREHKGRRYIATKVTIEILEAIKGSPGRTVVLDMVGGRIGEDELVIDGAPKFHPGDEDILFIKANGIAFNPLVGIMHGRYPILREAKTGKAYAVRNNGMPLYSERDVSLPMTELSAVKTANPSAKPMTADAFTAKIRANLDSAAAHAHQQ